MNKSGPNNGIGSDAFMGAVIFFKKRQIAGIGMPRKKKTKIDAPSDSKSETDATKKSTKKDSKEDLDVSDIKLDGQDNDSVPIYDTPDDVRSKINAHLRNSSGTQASLVRGLKAQFANPPSQGLSPAALKTFLSASGHGHGKSSPIAYAAYMYFEKLRIKNGKAKSKKRQEMEKVWGKGGMDLFKDVGKPITMRIDDVMWSSQYGEVEIGRGGQSPKKAKDGLERKWKAYGGK